MQKRRQFNALFKKNWALQRHQIANTLCQLLVPVILVSVIGILQWVLDEQMASEASMKPPDEFAKLPIYKTFGMFPILPGKPLRGLPYFRAAVNNEDPAERARIIGEMGSMLSNGSHAGFLGQIPSTPFVFMNPIDDNDEREYNISFPHFIGDIVSPDQMNADIVTIYDYWNKLLKDKLGFGKVKIPSANIMMHMEQRMLAELKSQELPDWIKNIFGSVIADNYTLIPPFGAIIVNQLAIKNDSSSKSLLDITLRPGGRYGGWGPLDSTQEMKTSKLQLFYPEIDRIGNLVSLMTNAFTSSVFGPDSPKILTHYQGMPQKVLNPLDLSTILGTLLLGFAMSFLLPTFISNIVIDKHEKILLLMQLSGLKLNIYWLVTVLYNMFTYTIVMSALWISGAAFKMRFFTQTDPLILVSLLLVWGLALNAIAFFFAAFFTTPRTSSIMGYFVVIFSVTISNFMNATVFLSDLPPLWFFLYPPFTFFRAIFVMSDACIRLQCLTTSDLVGGPSHLSFMSKQFGTIYLMLFVMSIVFFAVAWVLHNAGALKASILARIRSWERYSRLESGDSQEYKGKVGDDVLNEEAAVRDEQYDLSSIAVKSLSKTYPNGFTALHPLSFTIRKGECFGLLGANGAGKTTFISCLTGIHECSGGTVLFDHGQLDLRSDLTVIQTKIGISMQFDVLYPHLSAVEHLYFYSRLKGVEESALEDHVKFILSATDLEMVKHRQSRFLSGGMRRRLSFGIAMTGNPELIILDEPTTGLDIKTVKEVWKVFQSLRKMRNDAGDPISVLLTTHDMGEADDLCDRIGIMSQGRLKCIGAPAYLKEKFDVGYTLSLQVTNAYLSQSMLTLVDDNDDDVSEETTDIKQYLNIILRTSLNTDAFELRFLPEQSLNHLLKYHIKLTSDADSISSIYFLDKFISFMSRGKMRSRFSVPVLENGRVTADERIVMVTEWGMDRTSLEDVFLSVI